MAEVPGAACRALQGLAASVPVKGTGDSGACPDQGCETSLTGAYQATGNQVTVIQAHLIKRLVSS